MGKRIPLIVVELTTVILVKFIPPMDTFQSDPATLVAPIRSVPVIVIGVPPAVEPVTGMMLTNVGRPT